MIRLMSSKRAMEVLERYDGWIETVARRYSMPSALLKAILYQEMTQMDVLDPVADIAVQIAPRYSRDSSTGYAQIFGRTGLAAVNYAVDRGLATYESLGIDTVRRLDSGNARDVHKVWRKLHRDPHANIEVAALVLLMIADELLGRTDFETFTDNEVKLVMTRYNADVDYVTKYGEQAFGHYRQFRDRQPEGLRH